MPRRHSSYVGSDVIALLDDRFLVQACLDKFSQLLADQHMFGIGALDDKLPFAIFLMPDAGHKIRRRDLP